MSEPRTIVVVGGVAGGMSAAARARRLDEDAEIIVFEQGDYVSFANCGLPYHLSGEIARRESLLLHTPASLGSSLNLDVRTGHRVTGIDRDAQEVTVETEDRTFRQPYDALLLSRTSTSVAPSLTSSRARMAFTVGRMRPSSGTPPNRRRARSRRVGFWPGVGVVVKVSSIRLRQHTPGGIHSKV